MVDDLHARTYIKTLEIEQEHLENACVHLEKMSDMISSKQQVASQDLEGNQFEIATEEINQLLSKIEASRLHLKTLSADIETMIEDVKQYLTTAYEGK